MGTVIRLLNGVMRSLERRSGWPEPAVRRPPSTVDGLVVRFQIWDLGFEIWDFK